MNNWKWCLTDSVGKVIKGWYQEDENGHMLNDSLVSDDCIDFVKSFEGFFPNKYYDCVGVLTQGYGMTGSEIANLPDEITEETASNMFKVISLNTNSYVSFGLLTLINQKNIY